MALTKLPTATLSSNLLKFCLPSLQTSPSNQSAFVCSLHTCSPLSAGHSKWANIKHVKGARDKALASVASRLAQELKVCLTKYPNPDPKLNPQLGAIIQKARKNQISNDLISKAIDRVIKSKDPKNITAFDARGPGNTGIIVECFSPNPNHTKGMLQGMVKKHGFTLMQSAKDLFRHTGYIAVSLPTDELPAAQSDPENFSIDKYVDLAIEAGAEDVSLEPGEDGPYLQFECHPNTVAKVSRTLEEQGNLAVESAEPVYVANDEVPVSQEFMDSMTKMVGKVEGYPEFIKFYTNVVPEDASS